MPAVATFDLDAAVGPLAQDLMAIVVADTPEVLVNARGFLATDTVLQASFTAKVNPADSDTAPTTVQVIIQNDGSGSILPLGASGTAYQLTFPLTVAQTQALAVLHGYDIRVWISRGGVLYDRTIQNGNILPFLGWTSRTALVGGGLTTESTVVLTREG